MPISQIKKRNGDIVDFDKNKIFSAVSKASNSIGLEPNKNVLEALINEIVLDLEKHFVETVPSVEDIQDYTERALMKNHWFDVAKSYIIYRKEHEEMREEEAKETLEKLEKQELTVIKRDGSKEAFQLDKIRKVIGYTIRGHEKNVDVEAVLEDIKSSVYDGIKTSEIDKALVMVAKTYIEKDPAYTYVTARLFMIPVYKEVFGSDYFSNPDENYRKGFVKNLKIGVEDEKLSKELLNFDLNVISNALKPERDGILEYLGLQTLYDRYFIHINKKRIEAPQTFWMRVAMGLAIKEERKEEKAIEFYNVLSQLHFVSSTPTLFNSGTTHSQLSSCYLSTVMDDLHHIFKVYSDNGQLSKWAGGIGNDWTNVRATGAYIKGTNGESQGVIPFLKINNDIAVAVNQGGKRKGAICSYLETWHLDIEDFLELRKNTGDERRRTHDMNTSNWIPDLFIKRVMTDADWTLFSPNNVPELHDLYGKAFEDKYREYEKLADEGKIRPFRRVKANDLWKKMLTMLFETGHPWITFKDPCNLRSPQDHAGVVHNSNLCTEITLNTSATETAVCNLGSINLSLMIKDGKLDEALIAATVKTGMRMLDNVVDINYYPTVEAENSNKKHRPVGLGIMGLQDALYQLDLVFDSEDAVRFSDISMEIISYYTILASTELAKERGTYESFKGSKWDRGMLPLDTIDYLEQERGMPVPVDRSSTMDWNKVREAIKQYGMRNSNCMAIAPTATISNIAHCLPCIEPIYKNMYVKSNLSGEFTVINDYLVEDLKKLGIWNDQMSDLIKYYDGSVQAIDTIPQHIRSKYKEVFEIDSEWLVFHAARRGKWIDQAQSLNIFMKGTSGKKLNDTYLLAWKMGLKTTYYLRSLAISQVEKSTVKISELGQTHKRSEGVIVSATETIVSPALAVEIPANDQKTAAAIACSILNGADCEACQ